MELSVITLPRVQGAIPAVSQALTCCLLSSSGSSEGWRKGGRKLLSLTASMEVGWEAIKWSSSSAWLHSYLQVDYREGALIGTAVKVAGAT